MGINRRVPIGENPRNQLIVAACNCYRNRVNKSLLKLH